MNWVCKGEQNGTSSGIKSLACDVRTPAIRRTWISYDNRSGQIRAEARIGQSNSVFIQGFIVGILECNSRWQGIAACRIRSKAAEGENSGTECER